MRFGIRNHIKTLREQVFFLRGEEVRFSIIDSRQSVQGRVICEGPAWSIIQQFEGKGLLLVRQVVLVSMRKEV